MAGSWPTSPSQAASTGRCELRGLRRSAVAATAVATSPGSMPAAGAWITSTASRSGVSQQHLQSRRIGVAARIRPEIHRARQRGDLAHGSGDRRMDRRRRPHQRPAAEQQRVGRELGRPVTVGEQREPALAQPVAAACSAWAQAGGSGEQLLDRADPDQAGPSEGRVVDLVPVQAQAGAAGPLRRRAELPAGLEHEHGLDAGGGARSRHEAPRVGDAFEMDQDGPGREVQGQVVQDVAQLHLGDLAQRRRCARSRSSARPPIRAWRSRSNPTG